MCWFEHSIPPEWCSTSVQKTLIKYIGQDRFVFLPCLTNSSSLVRNIPPEFRQGAGIRLDARQPMTHLCPGMIFLFRSFFLHPLNPPTFTKAQVHSGVPAQRCRSAQDTRMNPNARQREALENYLHNRHNDAFFRVRPHTPEAPKLSARSSRTRERTEECIVE